MKRIAEIYEMEPSEVDKVTTATAKRLFRLP
jgi:Tat protein secretion system quality control protein TatD with DNase activity